MTNGWQAWRAGGNIHYERFLEEVIPFISKKEPFAYYKFDCRIMGFVGTRKIGDRRFRAAEGSYSRHPEFGKYVDVTVFSNVDPKDQIECIRKRNKETGLEMFCGKWIAMEEKYFKYYSIKDSADVTV